MLGVNLRRIGRFNVSRPLIEDPAYEKMVLSIFGNIKILRAQFNYQRDLFEYEGIYSGFDALPHGSFIPEYELIFDSKTLNLSVKRVPVTDMVLIEGRIGDLNGMIQGQNKIIAELREQLASMTLKLNTSLDQHPKLPEASAPTPAVTAVEVKQVRKPRVKKAAE